MDSKVKLAITLGSVTFIFIVGILAVLSVYLLKNTINADYLHSKTTIMKKFIEKNKGKLPKNNEESMKK